MDFRQLEMFVAVYEERSFKHGARRVWRTQPAVSLAIAKLEKELGCPLLERKRGGPQELHLTKPGELLLDYASRMFELRDELRDVLNPGRRRQEKSLRLGLSERCSGEYLQDFFARFQKNRPHLCLEVCPASTEGALRDLRERKLDVAILDAVPRSVSGNLETRFVTARGRHARPTWLLRTRGGGSHLCLEFEREFCSFVATL
jgi:LysR family transcriptional regulator, hydrogen peroxide-inducible genes activator